jgi:hypothetical protein
LDNGEPHLGPRSGRLFEFGNNWDDHYSREAAAFLKATNNNNYGREAAVYFFVGNK